jgi:hypothetical protein
MPKLMLQLFILVKQIAKKLLYQLPEKENGLSYFDYILTVLLSGILISLIIHADTIVLAHTCSVLSTTLRNSTNENL